MNQKSQVIVEMLEIAASMMDSSVISRQTLEEGIKAYIKKYNPPFFPSKRDNALEDSIALDSLQEEDQGTSPLNNLVEISKWQKRR